MPKLKYFLRCATELADHMTGAFSPDLESSDDCEPSETETETASDSVLDESYEPQLGAIDINDHTTFVVVLTKAHIQHTLVMTLLNMQKFRIIHDII